VSLQDLAHATLWIVVAVALISGTEYFARFLQQVLSFTGPSPPVE